MTSFFNALASDCVIACRRSGYNVIAYEDGVSIFEKVLIQPHDKEAIVVAVRSRSSVIDKEGPINLNCNVPA